MSTAFRNKSINSIYTFAIDNNTHTHTHTSRQWFQVPHIYFNWMWLITFRYRPSPFLHCRVCGTTVYVCVCVCVCVWLFYSRKIVTLCLCFRHTVYSNLFWLLDTENEFVICAVYWDDGARGRIWKKMEMVRCESIMLCGLFNIKTLPAIDYVQFFFALFSRSHIGREKERERAWGKMLEKEPNEQCLIFCWCCVRNKCLHVEQCTIS